MSATEADRVDVTTTDVVVIGAGAAGLTAALGLAPHRVTLLTKGRRGSSGSSPLRPFLLTAEVHATGAA
jgi:glycine/D-amino acid oxidase-like deaminating enzyme